jgi:hypothetical protein
MLRAFVLLHLAVLLSVGEAKPIEASRLVGTWEPSAPDMFVNHGQPSITYRADHTCTHKGYGQDGPSFAHGTWQLRGRELVTRFPDGLLVRETVLEVGADRFKTRFRIEGRTTIFTYTRVKP